MTRHIA